MYPRLFRLMKTQGTDAPSRHDEYRVDRPAIEPGLATDPRLIGSRRHRTHIRAGAGPEKPAAMKAVFAFAAMAALAACGDIADSVKDLPAKADAAVDQKGAVAAVTSAVDVEAAKGIATGAAREAFREVLPTGEIAAVAAVIDERAMVDGLDKAIDGKALQRAVQGAITEGGARATAPAE